ncbi:MAG: hypothetical protein GX288_07930 [Clostridiales bacterium]|jgi:hypothetical protein|nr:hypothetical protein [Clostridiales bacterium]
MENTCICCDVIIPEGRQVCPICERFVQENKNKRKKLLLDNIKGYKKVQVCNKN